MQQTTASRVGPGSPAFERRLQRLDAWGGDWTRPDRRYLKAQLLGSAIGWLATLVVLAVPLVMRALDWWSWPPMWLAWLLPLAAIVGAAIDVVLISRRVRARGYAARQDDLLVRRGIMWHTVTAVPYGRMQYIEVSQGPVDRLFGLAAVELHTASASTDVKILGISYDEAGRLREELARRGEDRLAGL